MRDALAVEQATDQPDGLVQPVQARPESGLEFDPEGVMLPLEPAAAEPEDRPTSRHVIERRGELGRESRIPDGVGTDEQAKSHALGQDRQGRKDCPTLGLRIGRVALVGQQVIVDPERIPARRLGREAGVAQGRPAGPVGPERRAEAHRHLRRCHLS